jgi:hypothetical protein
MNKGLVILIVAAIVGFAGFRLYKDWGARRGLSTPINRWITFTPQNKKFQVSLPTAPRYVDEVLPIPNSDKKQGYQIYAAQEMDGAVYMISIASYPADYDTSNKQELLNNLVDELLKKHDVKTILSRKKGTTQEGRDFQELVLTNNGLDIRGKAIVGDDKTIYVLIYTGPPDNFSIDEYTHFIDSFKILPQNHPAANQGEKIEKINTKH